jgi:hypothetical protein
MYILTLTDASEILYVYAYNYRDIWNRYSWAKVTRDLWTHQEVEHYSVTYSVRGHQGVVSDYEIQSSTSPLHQRDPGVQHAAYQNRQAQSCFMSAWGDASAPTPAHVGVSLCAQTSTAAGVQFPQPNASLGANSRHAFAAGHHAVPGFQNVVMAQAQPSGHGHALYEPSHNNAVPCGKVNNNNSPTGSSRRDGSVLPRTCSPMSVTSSSLHASHGNNDNNNNANYPHALTAEQSGMCMSASYATCDETLSLGDNKMSACNTEIDRMMQTPLGSATMPIAWPNLPSKKHRSSSAHPPKPCDLAYDCVDHIYNVSHPRALGVEDQLCGSSKDVLSAQGEPRVAQHQKCIHAYIVHACKVHTRIHRTCMQSVHMHTLYMHAKCTHAYIVHACKVHT